MYSVYDVLVVRAIDRNCMFSYYIVVYLVLYFFLFLSLIVVT